MKVHIVVPEHKSDWILARLARHLIEYNGWTAGRKPLSSADVNIYIPYLELRLNRDFHKKHKTKTAAWMTHFEPGDKCRSKAWPQACKTLTLRVTPSSKYVKMLKKTGRTALIPHPVELKKFVLKGRPRNSRPTIGVSGIVYPGGRKGQGLTVLLQKQRPEWKIVASGRGWPVGARWYQWKRLQEYYHGLDIFLCTSLIEGGPVTMLEALSCGRPVVVPEGVGAVDDLPKGPGIYRYEPGSYESMEAAIQEAISESPEPAIMRGYVEGMTPKKWAKDWRKAISKL